MKTSDIVKGGLIVAAIAGFFYFTNQSGQDDTTDFDSSTPQDTLEETENQIEERFRTEIPEGAERAELRSDDVDGRALATREVTDEGTTVSVLADLPDPETGFYQAWIQRGEEGEEEFERISLGRLTVAKGGYVTEYSSADDLSDYDQVVLSQETSQDSEPEEILIEGSFE